MDVDLFGNLVDVGKQATTDTFIIPLRKYPTAESIELRRITGDVKMYDVVLFPVMTSGEPNADALKKLAAVLADPLMSFARRSRAATRCPGGCAVARDVFSTHLPHAWIDAASSAQHHAFHESHA